MIKNSEDGIKKETKDICEASFAYNGNVTNIMVETNEVYLLINSFLIIY